MNLGLTDSHVQRGASLLKRNFYEKVPAKEIKLKHVSITNISYTYIWNVALIFTLYCQHMSIEYWVNITVLFFSLEALHKYQTMDYLNSLRQETKSFSVMSKTGIYINHDLGTPSPRCNNIYI